MAQVSITIRGRQYQIACDDGQEAHLARLGRYLDERAEQLVASTGNISEPLLLVMVALVVADELADAAAEVDALTTADRTDKQNDTALADAIDAVAARVEEVAERLEGS